LWTTTGLTVVADAIVSSNNYDLWPSPELENTFFATNAAFAQASPPVDQYSHDPIARIAAVFTDLYDFLCGSVSDVAK
jgi:hypothetical protein